MLFELPVHAVHGKTYDQDDLWSALSADTNDPEHTLRGSSKSTESVVHIPGKLSQPELNGDGRALFDVTNKTYYRRMGDDIDGQRLVDHYLDTTTSTSMMLQSINPSALTPILPPGLFLSPQLFDRDTTTPPNSSEQYLTPQSIDSRSTAGVSPPEHNQSLVSSSTPISPDIVSGPSSATPSSPIQFIQYKHVKARRKPEAQGSRVAKPKAKERKLRGLNQRPDVLQTDPAPKTTFRKDFYGKIAGTVTIFGLGQAVRTPPSAQLQLATSITRRIGACLRCRQNKWRCDMAENRYHPCSKCITPPVTFQYQPCIRVSILELNLHRKGPTLFNDLEIWVLGKQKLLASDAYNSNPPHRLFLTQGFGEGFENALSIKVSRFEPKAGDRTAYHWTDPSGQERTMEMPPYFISDTEAARRSVQEFLHNARSAYIEALLAESNPIVLQTFQIALTCVAFDQSKLISDALDTWVAARFIESYWRIFCGGAMIGLEPTTEPGHPYNDYIPVTPIMDTQLDDLIIRYLITPLTTRFLKRLKDKIEERKKENWLEIFLAMFIMMSNIGMVLKDVVERTTEKGLKSGSRGGTLTQGYIHACKTMLAYFHFACNGSIPFSISSEVHTRNGNNSSMTADQLAYLRSIQQELSRQESKLSRWKEISMYDDEIYWCYQLICKDWRGDIPFVVEIDDFTEYDFLSSSST